MNKIRYKIVSRYFAGRSFASKVFINEKFSLRIQKYHGLIKMKRSRDYGSSVEADPSEKRGWKIIHQSVVVTQISLRMRSLMAFVDLRIRPLDRNLKCKNIPRGRSLSVSFSNKAECPSVAHLLGSL
jgi:hypothetical protein